MRSTIFPITTTVAVWGGVLIFAAGCTSSPATVLSTPALQKPAQPTFTATAPAEIVAVSTATPTPRPTRKPTPTPKTPPMPIPTPAFGPFVYHTVTAGQTLGYISMLYNTPIEELVKMNELDGPEAIIQVDQELRVPVQTSEIAPDTPLLPDSEVVYGPSYVGFDLTKYVEEQGGYLASYQERVDGELLTGAEIVEKVSVQFSVGPRLLLAILEYYGEWVTNPSPTADQLQNPMGPRNPRGPNLYHSLAFTANRINAGYYGYKRDGFWIFRLPDGSKAISGQGLNAGTVGVQNIMAIHSNWDDWQRQMQGEGMLATYETLFGDPFERDAGPVVPIDLTQPPMSLPWKSGQGFYYTSGPHGGYVDGSAWAAIDFGPPDVLAACFYSNEPSTAVADGVIVSAHQGEVYLDTDGDGNIQTGWVLLYLHVALDIDTPVQAGQRVKEGDVIGYASCEGGLSNSSHLHLARRYNGEWMAAGGPVPMDLGGWVVQPNLVPYQGNIANGDELRESCECWEPDLNLIVKP